LPTVSAKGIEMAKNKTDRPKYIIKVTRDWRYGKRARFWEIQKWYERKDGGYWSSACEGGLAYSDWGMWRAIDKRLKKMSYGYYENYFSLDRQPTDKK
jgi:hypothetical protein